MDMQRTEELLERVRPMTGRVLVELTDASGIRMVRGIWFVDKAFKDQKYRIGTTHSVSRHGVMRVGAYLSPHHVKQADGVLIEKGAAKDVSGGVGLKPGTMVSIWENYVLAVVTLERDERSGDMKIMEEMRPMYDRAVLKRVEAGEKTPGGIFIPPSAQEKSDKGIVVAVGPGRLLQDGTLRQLDLQVGDTVLFGKYSGTEIKVSVKQGEKLVDEDRVIVKEDDILAVFPRSE